MNQKPCSNCGKFIYWRSTKCPYCGRTQTVEFNLASAIEGLFSNSLAETVAFLSVILGGILSILIGATF